MNSGVNDNKYKKPAALCSWEGNRTVVLGSKVHSQHLPEDLMDRKPHPPPATLYLSMVHISELIPVS
ncbi:hypothetical protein L873DRAFT_1814948 [Choiromyces venosus 120613-1]|uniref:Uncharacterized protein n=1 Tax=Choiromyces venosus 120613-1 TaxID=1336337 RepID=A0A3N4J6W1_9PEZI|nr:hypothetical protein L873DRAFT_1814948 [Choiromyces venosus 120613-1]